MKMPFLKLGFLMLVLACLVACSNSNNLQDPTSSSATTETSCDPSVAGCVQGQFVADEVVAGLSYTCTSTDQSVTVTSVTDANGFFTCPSGAAVTFYIGTAASSNQVVLGAATVTPQALPSLTTAEGSSSSTSGVVTISPVNLVLSSSITGVLGDPTVNSNILNIVRFLKALDSDGNTWASSDFSGFNGSNRIVISDEASEEVVKLNASLTAAEFTGSDLSPALQSFIDSIPGKDHTVDVPPVSIAQQQLRDFLNSSFAGVYVSSGLPCSTTDLSTTFGQLLYSEGMCNQEGTGSAPRSGDLTLFVDRTGYGFGFGVTSQSNNIASPPVSNFYIEGQASNPVDNGKVETYAAAPLQRPFDYTSNELSLNAESQVSGSSTADMTWTGLLQGGAIASTDALYSQIYGKTLQSGEASTLGAWTYGAQGGGNYVASGQFFMYNSKPANKYLDASVYGQLTFPINLQLTFEYSPATGSTCAFPSTDSGFCLLDTSPPTGVTGASSSYGSIGTLQISILKNGNIVTNLNQDCNQLLDPTAASLVDTNGQSEYRIGFVSTVTSGTMPSDTKDTVNQLSLTLLFPKNTNVNLPTKLQGVLAGVSSSSLFELPVSGGSSYTVKVADTTYWSNYFDVIGAINTSTGTTSGTIPADGAGVILVKKVTNKDPVSGNQCSS